ncbi:MAG: O-antigen ligase family protein [Planctomycetota bacterium]
MIPLLFALLMVFAHSQDMFAIAAPASLMLFVLANSFPRPNLNVFREMDFFLGIVLTVYSVAVAWIHNGDMIAESPIGYFAGDGRATYVFGFYLAIRLSVASRPEAYRDLVWSCLAVASAIACLSIFSFVTQPISFGDNTLGSMSGKGGKVAVGLLGTKNSYAGSNTGALVLALGMLLIQPRQWMVPRLPLLLASLILAAGLMLSGSRGYLLGALAAGAITIIWFRSPGRPSSRQLVSGVLVGAAAVLFLAVAFVAVNTERVEKLSSGNDKNVVRRFKLFEYTLSQWGKSSLIGIGPGSITQPDLVLRETAPPWFSLRVDGHKAEDGFQWQGDLPLGQHAHNLLLQLGADYGLIGLLLLAALILSAIRGGVFRHSPAWDEEEVFRRRIAVVSLIYLVVAGAAAGYTLTSASIAWSTWALIAGCRPSVRDPHFVDEYDDHWAANEPLESDEDVDESWQWEASR